MATTLIVPTRNRPRQMQDFLAFIAKFYPGSKVVVLDGSELNSTQLEVAEVCAAFEGPLSVVFKSYPADIPLFERLLDGVLSVSDKILAVAADDDFPMLEAYGAAAEILVKDESISTVVPYDIVLTLGKEQSLSARLSVARSVRHPTAAKRVDGFSRWRFATSYGATRKATLLARYRALSETYCAGFIDYQIGVEDCLEGEVVALPQLGCLRTHTYTASYLRPADKLVFLRRAKEVLAIAEHTAVRLEEVDGLSKEQAQSVSNTSMVRQIGSLVGAGAFSKKEFMNSPTFLKGEVQEQFKQFYQLFEEGSAMRAQYFERLSFITKCLINQSQTASQERLSSYEVL